MSNFDLAALKAKQLPRIDADTLLTMTPSEDEPTVETLAQLERTRAVARTYFAHFAEMPKRENANMVSGSQDCLGCGKHLDGLLGTFTYDLTHGEGRCSECGYPSRTHHYLRDENGVQVMAVARLLLQYHPDELRLRADEDDAQEWVEEGPAAQPGTRTVRSKPCPGCGSVEEIEVDEAGYRAWKEGELIQRALPALTAAQRERLMTGYCDPCWDRDWENRNESAADHRRGVRGRSPHRTA